MKSKMPFLAIALLPCWGFAIAADTGQLPCGTTAECNQQAAKVGATIEASNASDNTTSKIDRAEDQFFWLNKINKASVVMLAEEKIISREMGRKIAQGINHTLKQAREPEGKRPSNVIQNDRIITDYICQDPSLIHAGLYRPAM